MHHTKHPKELFLLSLAELCERYVFWGVGCLLVLYMVDYYKASVQTASHTYGMFVGIAAFLPLLGGYIADRWNYHHPLLLGAFINAIGCFLIATGVEALLWPALITIALGYGLFTPSIVALLGYTYRDRPHLREAGFSIYYACINIGVFLAMISLGYIAQKLSWNIAFMVAGCVQILGLIPAIVYIHKHHVKYMDLHPRFLKKGKEEGHKLNKQQKNRLIVILTLMVFSIFFWVPFSQGYSSMSIFALHFTDRTVFNFEMPAAWVLSAESFFLILLAPILAYVYKYLQKIKRDPAPATKSALSLFLIAICFVVMMIASKEIPPHALTAKTSFFLPVIAFFFMAFGEMLLAPIGLAMVSQLAPRRFTALLVGGWYVCVGLSFYIGGLFAGLIEKIPNIYDFFSHSVLIAAVPGAVLLLLAKKLTKMSGKEIHTL